MYFTISLAYLTSHSVCIFSILSIERKSTVKSREVQSEIIIFSSFLKCQTFLLFLDLNFSAWVLLSVFQIKALKQSYWKTFFFLYIYLLIIYCMYTYLCAFGLAYVSRDYRTSWGSIFSFNHLAFRSQAYVSSLVKVYLLSLPPGHTFLFCSNILSLFYFILYSLFPLLSYLSMFYLSLKFISGAWKIAQQVRGLADFVELSLITSILKVAYNHL